tara:strand:+ start:109 stop:891 length:783 start_codon:yes stop_codon:yes gene_type:complete
MKRSYDKKINQHYDKVAIKRKKSKFSTMEDEYIRDQETNYIVNIIKNHKKNLNILDIGCGNGYTLDQISKMSKKNFLYGMDNNESLFKIAHKRLYNKVRIIKSDIRNFNKNFKNKFDIVISQRVLINILNESDQKKALKNIISYIKKNGKFIAIESFNSGLKKLNNARVKFNIKKIKPKFHNKYLKDDFFKTKRLRKLDEENKNLSKHVFIARFLDEIYLKSKKTSKFSFNSKFVKYLDNTISELDGNYSHLKLLLFKKR